MCNQFSADEFDAAKRYIVFDDIDIDFFPSWKAWFGAQKQFTITDKYRAKRTIRWGKPMIWLCNDDNDPRLSKALNKVGALAWLDQNCKIVDVNRKLF